MSRRNDLQNTKTQIKLFNTIAAAVVLGGSLLAPTRPASAGTWFQTLGNQLTAINRTFSGSLMPAGRLKPYKTRKGKTGSADVIAIHLPTSPRAVTP